MADPFKAKDVKVGKTGNPVARLGVYQNSYSRNSHIAEFNQVWFGNNNAVNFLETAIKNKHRWEIEADGRGFSEWVNNVSVEEITDSINTVITEGRFKVYKLPAQYLPLNINNLNDVLEYIETQTL